jgi:hypothetical protein
MAAKFVHSLLEVQHAASCKLPVDLRYQSCFYSSLEKPMRVVS